MVDKVELFTNSLLKIEFCCIIKYLSCYIEKVSFNVTANKWIISITKKFI